MGVDSESADSSAARRAPAHSTGLTLTMGLL
jgi:hypothetical protein